MSILRHAPVPAALAAALAAAAPASAAERFVIRGAGFGHGVGMSQYGAYGFAKEGRSYTEILRHYYTGTRLSDLSGDSQVRVLLRSASQASFTGASRIGDRRLQPGSTYSVRRHGLKGVELRSSSGRRLQRWGGPVSAGGSAPVKLLGGTSAGVTDGRYRGRLEFRPGPFGVSAVNVVGLEDYVRGVVAAESPSSWPAEALKAQAVAARTYAITTSKQGGGFDHYADTRSQVYKGVAGETASTDAAVRATADEVVTAGGRPVVTYFFSTSGGRTEDVENVFGGAPQSHLKSVEDPFDTASPRHRWGPYRWSMSRAQRALGSWVKGSFRGIKVLERGSSPRIRRAQVIGSRGRTTVTGAQLRARLGLNDTWAYFSTISTTKKRSRAASERAVGRVLLSGSIVPGDAGNRLRVERRSGGEWRLHRHVETGKGGRYGLAVDQPGTYRVVERGMAGPSVTVRYAPS